LDLTTYRKKYYVETGYLKEVDESHAQQFHRIPTWLNKLVVVGNKTWTFGISQSVQIPGYKLGVCIVKKMSGQANLSQRSS
jgi:hypothetical protein